MELGNVYEVFQIGDRVEINDICYVYYGRKGTIIGIKETGPHTEPIYTIALDGAWTLDDDGQGHVIEVNASALAKIPRKNIEEEPIMMGLRSCKTLYRNLKEFQDKRIGSADEMKNVDVKKIIFNGPKTIVLWSDGTKTIVSMSKDETNFDPEAAFCAAYTKKMFGANSKIKRIIKEKSNFEKWKELNEVPEDQLYNLGLKALAKCNDLDMEAIERATKEAEKLTPEILKNMYETLTGHPYKGEKGNDEN